MLNNLTNGGANGSRTHKTRGLSSVRLPITSPPQIRKRNLMASYAYFYGGLNKGDCLKVVFGRRGGIRTHKYRILSSVSMPFDYTPIEHWLSFFP